LFNVMSISSWSLHWTSGCVASRCVAKHKCVEAVSKPATKNRNTCAAKSSSSHSVSRTQDSNSDKHAGYEKCMQWRHDGMWSKHSIMNESCVAWECGCSEVGSLWSVVLCRAAFWVLSCWTYILMIFQK
jgi:hypothetical protein